MAREGELAVQLGGVQVSGVGIAPMDIEGAGDKVKKAIAAAERAAEAAGGADAYDTADEAAGAATDALEAVGWIGRPAVKAVLAAGKAGTPDAWRAAADAWRKLW